MTTVEVNNGHVEDRFEMLEDSCEIVKGCCENSGG